MSGTYLESDYFPAKTGTGHAGHYEVIECSVHQKSTRRSREMSPSALRTSLDLSRLSFFTPPSPTNAMLPATPPVAKCHGGGTARRYCPPRPQNSDQCRRKTSSG